MTHNFRQCNKYLTMPMIVWKHRDLHLNKMNRLAKTYLTHDTCIEFPRCKYWVKNEEHFPEAAVGRKTQKCRSQMLMIQKEMLNLSLLKSYSTCQKLYKTLMMPTRQALVHKRNLYILSNNTCHLLTTFLLLLNYFRAHNTCCFCLRYDYPYIFTDNEEPKNNIIVFQFMKLIYFTHYSSKSHCNLSGCQFPYIDQVIINSQLICLMFNGPTFTSFYFI